MHANIKKCITGLSLLMGFHCASAQEQEDFLNAPDRIEWDAGGLYDGRFDDGTPFQIQIAYPKPGSAPIQAGFWNMYWYPRHFTGARIALSSEKSLAGEIKLVQWKPIRMVVEAFSITLSPDRLSGSGSWTSAALGKRHSFVLHRAIVYRALAVTRPAPPAPPGVADEARPFVFSAIFPVLKDSDANDWIREKLKTCTDTSECANAVLVDWRSSSLLSLNAATYGYSSPGAHGNTETSMRHYLLKDGKMTKAGLDAFLEQSPDCRAKTSTAIVSKLRAQKMDYPENGVLNERYDPKFLALPDGLEFHFDSYEVGNYAQGMPAVFVSRAELGQCVRNLPGPD